MLFPLLRFQTEHPILSDKTPVFKVAGFSQLSSTACVFVAGEIDGDFLRGTVFAIVDKYGTIESHISTGHPYFYEKSAVEKIGEIHNQANDSVKRNSEISKCWLSLQGTL